jgi:hypothetical protein
LTGKWKRLENNFVITLNQDFDFVDIYSKTWKGVIKIDNVSIETENLNWYIENALGEKGLYSSNIQLTFYPNSLIIYYLSEKYILNDTYLVDLNKGLVIAKGIAYSSQKQINIDINLKAQVTTMKKGIESLLSH